MTSLRIILLMLEPPLPFGDAAARVYYPLLKTLVERGHRVTAFATCSKPDQIAKAKALFPEPHYDLRCYANPQRRRFLAKLHELREPYSYMFDKRLRADLERELSAGFDVLHLEQLFSGWLGLPYTARSLVSVHFLFSIDLGEHPPRTLRDKLERVQMLRAEHRLLRAFRFFRTLSSRLAEPIQKVNLSADVSAVPIGLDLGLYPYVRDDRRPRTPTVTLIGSMQWYPTRSAAVRMLTRLYPQIKRRVPDARLQIVGWSARSALREYLHQADVEIFENVSDTRPFFENSSVLLYAPARASGMKVKILEAMAFGVPVVTTSEGVEGLSATDGVEAGIADDDQGLIERVVALLTNRKLQNRQREAARELISRACNPSHATRSLERIYQRIVGPDKIYTEQGADVSIGTSLRAS
jgi:glycosyltransferase involved in cell wall biosynthesis